jgi:hypothetical protein
MMSVLMARARVKADKVAEPPAPVGSYRFS